MRRTLTGYGIAVVIVLAALNGITWLVGMPWLHDLNVFSAGFVLGMLGMYIAACFTDIGGSTDQVFKMNHHPDAEFDGILVRVPLSASTHLPEKSGDMWQDKIIAS